MLGHLRFKFLSPHVLLVLDTGVTELQIFVTSDVFVTARNRGVPSPVAATTSRTPLLLARTLMFRSLQPVRLASHLILEFLVFNGTTSRTYTINLHPLMTSEIKINDKFPFS